MGEPDRAAVALRPADAADGALLGRVLMDAAFRPGLPRPPLHSVLADPAIGHYIEGWPRPGDHGLVAEAGGDLDGGGEAVGGAWFRFFGADDPGYGFVDEATPELSIAVLDGWRGKGVGRILLARLLADAAGLGIPRLALSVALENTAAVHLYRSLGFVPVGGPAGGSITMVSATMAP